MTTRSALPLLALLLLGCSNEKKIAQARAEVDALQRELDSKAPYTIDGKPVWAECPGEEILSKHVDPWGRQYWIELQAGPTLEAGTMFASYRCAVACDGPDRVAVGDDIRAK